MQTPTVMRKTHVCAKDEAGSKVHGSDMFVADWNSKSQVPSTPIYNVLASFMK